MKTTKLWNMRSDYNFNQLLKIDARAIYDHELFDAFCDISYAIHLLEADRPNLRARYGVSCGDLAYLPAIENVGLAQEAWVYLAETIY